MMRNAMPISLERDVPLAPMTTIGIGGPARYFARAASADDLREIAAWASANGEPLLILGGGSNVVIADAGFNGVVAHIDLRGINVESEDRRSAVVNVAAGERWDEFVAMAVAKRWAGIECLSGIPGSVGATPIQNVGAYGQEVSETIVRVEVLERATGRVLWLTNQECGFGYRSSRFKGTDRDRFIVLSVTFRLQPDGEPAVRYPELKKYLEGRANDLQQVRDAVIAIRRRKGMVLDPADPDTRSDGSFFTNPIVTPAQFEALCARAGRDNIPVYPAGENLKLSAAWLIENAGFEKGFAHGKAAISSKHTLALVNRGGASARELLELARMIQDRVQERFGIELQPEPNLIGFDSPSGRAPA